MSIKTKVADPSTISPLGYVEGVSQLVRPEANIEWGFLGVLETIACVVV